MEPEYWTKTYRKQFSKVIFDQERAKLRRILVLILDISNQCDMTWTGGKI